MKKHIVLLLVFTLLCGGLSACGAVAPTDEPTASPTAISEATATPPTAETPTESPEATFVPQPTESPATTPSQEFAEVLHDSPPEEWMDFVCPEAYKQENLPDYMTFVNVAYKLYSAGNRVNPYMMMDGTGCCSAQFLSYQVNVKSKGDLTSYDLILYNLLENKIVQQQHVDFLEKALAFPDGIRVYTKEEEEEYEKDLEEFYKLRHDEKDEEWTTIAKETKGFLSGGIYDIEYHRKFDYVVFSPSGKYALVEQSLTNLPDNNSEKEDGCYLIRYPAPQTYALLDMNTGEIIKTYSIHSDYCDPNVVQFTEDDQYLLIYYNPNGGGSSYPISSAIVIDIAASLQSEE